MCPSLKQRLHLLVALRHVRLRADHAVAPCTVVFKALLIEVVTTATDAACRVARQDSQRTLEAVVTLVVLVLLPQVIAELLQVVVFLAVMVAKVAQFRAHLKFRYHQVLIDHGLVVLPILIQRLLALVALQVVRRVLWQQVIHSLRQLHWLTSILLVAAQVVVQSQSVVVLAV